MTDDISSLIEEIRSYLSGSGPAGPEAEKYLREAADLLERYHNELKLTNDALECTLDREVTLQRENETLQDTVLARNGLITELLNQAEIAERRVEELERIARDVVSYRRFDGTESNWDVQDFIDELEAALSSDNKDAPVD